MKTWNRERFKTRDRLLSYDSTIVPIVPLAGVGMPTIYPWENASLAILFHQFFRLAKENGYDGPENLLFEKFKGSSVHKYDNLSLFPPIGIIGDLYLDLETGTVYYYISPIQAINTEQVIIMGGVITGSTVNNEITETHLYLPIRTLPIENLIYDCGDAAEYID